MRFLFREAYVTLTTEAARGDYDWRSQYSAEELVPLGWQLKTSRTNGAPYYLEFWSNHVQEEDPRSPIRLAMLSARPMARNLVGISTTRRWLDTCPRP
jgi:hypothetical protein